MVLLLVICALNAKYNLCLLFFCSDFLKLMIKSVFDGEFWLNPSSNTEADLQENVE